MHAVGDSIDYKHSDDVTPDFGNDGYTYLLQYQFNELDESEMLDNFFFKSSEDRESFEQANVECGVEYFLATISYDERLYQLCMMIRSDWFCNNQNVWNLAGFFARQPHSDWYLMRKTYLCVLKQKVERFNKEFASKEFDGWFDSKYSPSLNEGKLKGIAAGCDSAAYKQWKDEYEVKEPRKTSTSKTFELSTLDQDFELTFVRQLLADTSRGVGTNRLLSRTVGSPLGGFLGRYGNVFGVNMDDNQKVWELKEKIKEKKPSVVKCEADRLTLYVANKGENWLTSDKDWLPSRDSDVKLLKQNQTPVGINAIMTESREMDPADEIGDVFASAPTKKVIHVLVKLPEAAVGDGVLALPRKRKLSEERLVKLKDLWDYSTVNIAALPKSTELKSMLQQPLPFRLALDDDKTAEKICEQNGDLLQCKDMTTMIESYLLECTSPVESMASENTWQAFYDVLFRIPSHLCLAKGIFLTFRRNRVENTGTTLGALRPDLILHYDGMVLLRGEEKSSSTVIDVSCKELTKKMRKWNPMFYGDLPYILGYATSGTRLKIVTIDRHLHAEKVVEFYSIIAQKEEVIKTFYNLSFFLVAMVTLSKRTCASDLMPYTPHITERRTIELMDDVVKRTIQRQQCIDEDDFRRLSDIYTTLQGLSSRGREKTHLQTVRKLEIPDEQTSSITVHLQPLGFFREPENVEEVYEWLQGMLTALKFWHGCNYCHGDLRWRNIVYVPTSDRGYWVLIDMDESHPPKTTTISWNHQCHGDILTFQHDLYQLGRLMEFFTVPLTDELLSVQTALLSAVTSQLGAEEVLTMMNQEATVVLQFYGELQLINELGELWFQNFRNQLLISRRAVVTLTSAAGARVPNNYNHSGGPSFKVTRSYNVWDAVYVSELPELLDLDNYTCSGDAFVKVSILAMPENSH
ncbi:unnamed protein product [Phytophthora lilii]|uniref:Unnamed protein product n=1 Tax=Phytophthora lilii TaxID=2077276 RepID=A0A9W6TGB6_9STRA|nr:unnamed protein product [Phytophthora lilii]